MAKATCGGLATSFGAKTSGDDVYIMLTNETSGPVIRASGTLVTLPGGGVGVQPHVEELIESGEATV